MGHRPSLPTYLDRGAPGFWGPGAAAPLPPSQGRPGAASSCSSHPTPSSPRIPSPASCAPSPSPVELTRPPSAPLPASPSPLSSESSRRQVQIGFVMAGSDDMRSLAASVGELHVEASPSRDEGTNGHGNGDAAAADDDVWGDASDSPGHDSDLKREWDHRQEQFHKMGYRDGITEGQKDVAQEGFNLGHRQSAHVGYKWGLVRGITSALASLPNNLKEKLLLDAQRRGKLEDLHKSVQEISAEAALRLFHESILQDNHQPEENKLQTTTKDLLLLLHECPDVQVSEELKRVP